MTLLGKNDAKLNYPYLINPRNDGLTFRQFHIGHDSQFGFKILNFQCNFGDFLFLCQIVQLD